MSKEENEIKVGGTRILTYASKEWPRGFEKLEDQPGVLFTKGDLELLNCTCVGIVGTRDCTRYGLEVAKEFAQELSSAGVVVVSGLADGIDAAAHNGAFPNTIAVLGNGIKKYYPATNQKLQDKIANEGGLVISEHEPSSSGRRHSFLHRNRIIASISQAVIVIEADYRSGALSTKNYALSCDIPVFAVPGSIKSHASHGTNDIIKRGEAKIVTNAKDVLVYLGLIEKKDKDSRDKNVVKDKTAFNKKIIQLSMEEQAIMENLRKGELHFDDIIKIVKMIPQKLATLLTNMELDDLIEKLPGNMYASKVI